MSALPLPTPIGLQSVEQDHQTASTATEVTELLQNAAEPHLHTPLIPTLQHLEVIDHEVAPRGAALEVLHSEEDMREVDIVVDRDHPRHGATLLEEIPMFDLLEHVATLGLRLQGHDHLHQ